MFAEHLEHAEHGQGKEDESAVEPSFQELL